MTVRATYQIDEKAIEELEMSITIRMRVREWRALMRHLVITGSPAPAGYESNMLSQTIAAALADLTHATERVYSFNDDPR